MLTQSSGEDATHRDPAASNNNHDPAAALLQELDRPEGPFSQKRRPPEASLDEANGAKRVRLHAPTAQARHLPAEIWQHIFTFLPPRTLGRLLLVNKCFHSCLDPESAFAPCCSLPTPPSSLKRLKPEAIWRASRRLFWHRMPAPLQGKAEIDMWRLACSPSCSLCHCRGAPSPAEDQWHRGPGAKGVSFVIPFSVAACGSCLARNALKEIDILLSSTTPSILIPGLPAILMTDQLHVVPPQVLQNGPSQAKVTKVFWSSHVGDIRSEFNEVKALGPAAAEEWVKGLESRGKNLLADASRWEKWDLSGGVEQMRTQLTSASDPRDGDVGRHAGPSSRQENAISIKGLQPWPSIDTKGLAGLPAKADTSRPQTRPPGQKKRTWSEAAELKAQRRAEIERRALLLDPPLPASVLAHIPSFQAALQISTPLDEHAWELLKPRLVAQREEAQRREKEGIPSAYAPKIKLEEPVDRDTEAATDRDWDEVQGPVRARISAYADEVIRDCWKEGDGVTKKSSPQFAAEVLLYVRKRFYADVAKDAIDALAAGKAPAIDPPEGPWTQKLTLENMKWVFQTKVKPFTESYRKELFLCNGCNGNYRYYDFEGVVQHYAAKHTGAFSLGSVVVYWRAEWPETPPFDPEPQAIELQRYDDIASYPSTTTRGRVQGFAAYHHGVSSGYPPASYGVPVSSYGYGYPTPHPTVNPCGPSDASAYGAYAANQSHAHDSGYYQYPPAPPYANHVHQVGIPATQGSYSTGYTPNPIPSAQPSEAYNPRIEAMARITQKVCNAVSSTKGLPSSVHLCAIIHHIAKIFQSDFYEAASLDMFIDGLLNRQDMRAARGLDELACKACATTVGYPEEPQRFSTLELATHFQISHTSSPVSQGVRPLDWRIDMVLLPDMPTLVGLRTMLSNNRPAYEMIADTLPWAFTSVSPENPVPGVPWPQQSRLELPNGTVGAGPGLPPPNGSNGYNSALEWSSISRQKPIAQPAFKSYYELEQPHFGQPYSKRSLDGQLLHSTSVVYGGADTLSEEPPQKMPRVGPYDKPARGGRVSEEYVSRRPPGDEAFFSSRQSGHPISGTSEHDFGLLDALESHLNNGNAQETRRPLQYPTANERHVYRDEPSLQSRQPHSSRYQPYPLDTTYRTQSPLTEYERPIRPLEQEQPRMYYDDPRARPGPIVNAYDLVEVRGPQGSYYIKRPIPPDDRDYPLYQDRAVSRDIGSRPSHRPIDQYWDTRPRTRASTAMPNQQPPDDEDYDPRYPDVGRPSA